ncbi:MAG: SRPBCC family protein, partial [Bacteroidota bacterium]|nr:SRPBCC family protein [Bacteroidota bacterium]
KFNIIGETFSDTMYEGQNIEYKVRAVLGIALYWMTEITHVKEKVFFIDEQRFGPYSFWHHQHHFKETDTGVEMTDLLHYKLPLYALGRVANKLFVEKQVKKIFDYRSQKIKELFG